jgi:hypothetical protein
MTDLALRVSNLGKQYFIGAKQERCHTFRDTLADAFAASSRRFRSLVPGPWYSVPKSSRSGR